MNLTPEQKKDFEERSKAAEWRLPRFLDVTTLISSRRLKLQV